jgi:hypothetical protein
MAEAPNDLVRIDENGTANAVSRSASNTLRARQGTYRLMPAPNHIVFMRYVGEDGRRDEDDGAVVKLSGEIVTRGTLCDIVALVGNAGWKGELVVLDGLTSRAIFFEGGNVICAQSTAEGERLGEILYQLGALTQEQVDQCMALEGRRLGDAAVELGFVTRERLYQLMANQAEEIVYKTLMVGDGMFYFLDRYDEARIASRHNIPATSLLMEGARRMDEMSYFRERIPSDDHVPVRVTSKKDPSDEFRKVWDSIDGERSVTELGRVCEMPAFDVTQALFQLCQSGHVQIRAPKPTDPVAIVETFNTAMRAIFAEVGAAGRAEELRAQLQGYSSSSGMYVALFMFAGPEPDGSVITDRVVANILKVAVDDKISAAAQWLYDYAAFANFAAGSLVPITRAKDMARQVGEMIAPLRQQSGRETGRNSMYSEGPTSMTTPDITFNEVVEEDEIQFNI